MFEYVVVLIIKGVIIFFCDKKLEGVGEGMKYLKEIKCVYLVDVVGSFMC